MLVAAVYQKPYNTVDRVVISAVDNNIILSGRYQFTVALSHVDKAHRHFAVAGFYIRLRSAAEKSDDIIC